MSNSKVSLIGSIELTKTAEFLVAPEPLTVIGIDDGGPGDRDYDDRVRAPIDASMVESIVQYGVIEPVTLRRDGDRLVVIDGRRRVLHARLANIRLSKDGQPTVQVPCRMTTGDELTTFVRARLANSYRLQDPAILNAKNARLMLDKGMPKDKVSVVFGVKPTTIDDWCKLLDLDDDVQKHIQEGWLSTNAGLALADLGAKEQKQALAKAKAAGVAAGKGESEGPSKVSTAKVIEAVNEIKETSGKKVTKTPKERVSKALETINGLAAMAARGERLTLDDYERAIRQLSLTLASSKFETLVKAQAALMDSEAA